MANPHPHPFDPSRHPSGPFFRPSAHAHMSDRPYLPTPPPPPPHHSPYSPFPAQPDMYPSSSYPYVPHPPHPPHPSHPPGLPSAQPGPFLPPATPAHSPGIPPSPGLPPSSMAYVNAAAPPSPVSSSSPHPGQGPFIPVQQQPQLIHHQSIVTDPLPHPSSHPYSYPPASYYTTDPRPPPQRLLQTAEVKLEIICKNLRDRDMTSKSDPTCVIFLEDKFASAPYHPNSGQYSHSSDGIHAGNGLNRGIKWREIGRTEYIKNNLNPHFKVQVKVPYHFEELQHIRLGLWDIDSRKQELRWHDFLGDVRTTLGELVTARVWTSPLSSPNIKDTKGPFGGKRDLGTITVIVHENQDGGNLLIKASLSGQKLDRKDICLSSDPYFIFTQIDSSSPSSRSQLYKSEVIKRNVNPVWKPCQLKAVIPKGGDKSDVMLEILVNDRDTRKRDDEIGVAKVTVTELEKNTSFPLINEEKQRRRKRRNKKTKHSGILEINSFSAIRMPSLVDYLQGGLKLHFSVAVDLTASNGPPSSPDSLHYRADMYTGNHYIHALSAVANVLSVYTPSDNRFAAFGFGAELPGNPGITSSCFPLGLGPDPNCIGIQGILHAYATALNRVKLSGPTFFAPLIETVSRNSAMRANTQTDQNYDVLLILTDGVVSDYDHTVDRIIAASRTVPLSIIIIGIGNRDFQKMKDLDCDNDLLKSRDGTRQAARDICQFVAFNEYEHAPPERLGAVVLQELPGNIVEYFVGACDPPIMPGQRPLLPTMSY